MASLHNGPAVLVPFIGRCDEGVGNQLLAFPEDLLRSIRDAVKNSEDDDREKEKPANRVSEPAGVGAFFRIVGRVLGARFGAAVVVVLSELRADMACVDG